MDKEEDVFGFGSVKDMSNETDFDFGALQHDEGSEVMEAMGSDLPSKTEGEKSTDDWIPPVDSGSQSEIVDDGENSLENSSTKGTVDMDLFGDTGASEDAAFFDQLPNSMPELAQVISGSDATVESMNSSLGSEKPYQETDGFFFQHQREVSQGESSDFNTPSRSTYNRIAQESRGSTQNESGYLMNTSAPPPHAQSAHSYMPTASAGLPPSSNRRIKSQDSAYAPMTPSHSMPLSGAPVGIQRTALSSADMMSQAGRRDSTVPVSAIPQNDVSVGPQPTFSLPRIPSDSFFGAPPPVLSPEVDSAPQNMAEIPTAQGVPFSGAPSASTEVHSFPVVPNPPVQQQTIVAHPPSQHSSYVPVSLGSVHTGSYNQGPSTACGPDVKLLSKGLCVPVASFGPADKLITMQPRRAHRLNVLARNSIPNNDLLEPKPGKVRVHSLRDVMEEGAQYGDGNDRDLGWLMWVLGSFPGPLGASTSKEDLLRCLQERSSAYENQEGVGNEEMRTLWEMVTAVVTSSDDTSARRSLVQVLMKNSDPNDRSVPFVDGEGTGEGQMERTAVRVEELLLKEDRAGACQCAMDGGCWGLALSLAAVVSKEMYNNVVTEFARRTFHPDSPLRSLLLSLGSNRQGGLFVDSHIASTWRRHLAMLLANPRADSSKLIVQLGDRVWEETGRAISAQCCYFAAQMSPESMGYSSRLVLLGWDHRNPTRSKSRLIEAIQMTELWEFSKRCRDPKFFWPSLGPWKLTLAKHLLEFGWMDKARDYGSQIMQLMSLSKVGQSVPGWSKGFYMDLSAFDALCKCSIDSSVHHSHSRTDSGSKFGWFVGIVDRGIQKLMVGGENEDGAKKGDIGANSGPKTPQKKPQEKILVPRSASQGAFGGIGNLLRRIIPGRGRQMDLGHESNFYYDENLKRWITEGEELNADGPAGSSQIAPPMGQARTMDARPPVGPSAPSPRTPAMAARQVVTSRYVDSFNMGQNVATPERPPLPKPVIPHHAPQFPHSGSAAAPKIFVPRVPSAPGELHSPGGDDSK